MLLHDIVYLKFATAPKMGFAATEVNVTTSQDSASVLTQFIMEAHANVYLALTFSKANEFLKLFHMPVVLCPEDGTCNGNGQCNNANGICDCFPGFYGKTCNCEWTTYFFD